MSPAETGLYYLQSRYYDPALCRFLNADGLASTGQGILGSNMFAYCGNEPVSGVDSTGTMMVSTLEQYRWDGSDLMGGAGGGGGIILLGLAALISNAIEAAGNAFYQAKETAKNCVSKVETALETAKNRNGRLYAVYFMMDSDGIVRYVGRVVQENLEQRTSFHKRTKGLKDFYFINNLTWDQARGAEEAGMLYFHTIHRGIPYNNQIHGISKSNKNYQIYMDAINRYANNKFEELIYHIFNG